MQVVIQRLGNRPLTNNRCTTCQFCVKESDAFWTCRFNPPTFTRKFTAFPAVHANMWCGKYVPDSIDAILALNAEDHKIESMLTGNVMTFKIGRNERDENND